MADEKSKLTVFSQSTEFDGVLEFSDNLVIAGKFRGTISAGGNLEIEKTAECDVDYIKAESIVVSGSVNGKLEATDRVELCSGSKVNGDIKTARLRISDNVDFNGKVHMIDGTPETDIFSVASSEFKKSLLLKTNEAR